MQNYRCHNVQYIWLLLLKATRVIRLLARHKLKCEKTGDLSVPLHIRNAPTKLMKELGYGKEYKYAHSYDNGFIDQEFLPDEISGQTFYRPGANKRESAIKEWLKSLWKNRYDY